MNGQTKYQLTLWTSAVFFISACGDAPKNEGNAVVASRAIAAMPAVKVADTQLEALSLTMGVPKSNTRVQTALAQRGNGLPNQGGALASYITIQSNLDLAAAFCIAAREIEDDYPPGDARRLVYPSIRLDVAPSATNFPLETVLKPWAKGVFVQLTGERVDAEQVGIVASAVQSFLADQAAVPGTNNATGTQRSFEVACSLVASTIGGSLSY